MTIIYGRLVNDFVGFGTTLQLFNFGLASSEQLEDAASRFNRAAALNATYLVYIGIGVIVTVFIYMYFWVYTGEVNSKRIRENYLNAVLRQDIAFFDNVGAGEVATRIQTDTRECTRSRRLDSYRFLNMFYLL